MILLQLIMFNFSKFCSMMVLLCIATHFLWQGIFNFKNYSNGNSNLFSNVKLLESNPDKFNIIFLVIDAFRYDQVAKFPFIRDNLEKNNQNTKLLKVIANSPTMTTERIQVMMSGIDMFRPNIFDNFFTKHTSIDNILNQINQSLLLGDDTWNKLFNFKKSITCNSFKVSDFDTCDNIIMDNLEKQYKKNEYRIIIGHFLGLDHIGHTFSSVNNTEYTQKLIQISNFLYRISRIIKNDTILIVLGDHGMKNDGNHGGSSKLQKQTILFTYSKQKLIKKIPKNEYKQIDIAITLSLLLNISIPTQNLGKIIQQIIPIKYENKLPQINEKIKHFLKNRLNNMQIQCEQTKQEDCIQKIKLEFNTIKILLSILLYLFTYLYISYTQYIKFRQHLIIFAIPIINFSWMMIKHQVGLVLFIYLIFMIVSINKFKHVTSLIWNIFLILLICQFQKQRNDQYLTSWIYIKSISNIIRSNKGLILLKFLCFGSIIAKIKKESHEQKKIKILLFISVFLIFIISLKQFQQNQMQYILKIFLTILLIVTQYCNNTILSTLSYHLLLLLYLSQEAIIVIIINIKVLQIIQASSIKFKEYLFYINSDLIWMVLGNRYDYSTIDITKSYVYTDQYILPLNMICLWIFLLVPYLTSVKLLYSQSKNTIKYVRIGQKQYTKQIQNNNQFSGMKFLMIGIMNLITSAICLYININKILYTVVYVPIFIFSVLKCFSLCLIILIFQLSRRFNKT